MRARVRECHHRYPLSVVGPTKTCLADLVLLCSNCRLSSGPQSITGRWWSDYPGSASPLARHAAKCRRSSAPRRPAQHDAVAPSHGPGGVNPSTPASSARHAARRSTDAQLKPYGATQIAVSRVPQAGIVDIDGAAGGPPSKDSLAGREDGRRERPSCGTFRRSQIRSVGTSAAARCSSRTSARVNETDANAQ